MALKTTRWDAAEALTTPERVAAYLEEAFNDGDPALIAYSLGVAARAKGMTGMARKTGISRQTLYRALSDEGNPEFTTVLKVLHALGLRLHATAI
jgi:probable addiction module antidote protein